jgi:hypothetical protein
MAYTPTTWKDRSVEKPRTYNEVANGDGTITLNPSPGTIYEAGTPVNAANMNKIEQGVAAALPKDGSVSMTGNLSTPGVTISGELAFSGGGKLGDDGTSSTFVKANGNSFDIIKEDNSGFILRVSESGTFTFKGNNVITSAGGLVNGALTINDLLNLTTNQGVSFGSGGRMLDDVSKTVLFANNDTFEVTNEANNAYIIQASMSQFAYKGNAIWDVGQLRNNSGVLELNVGGTWTPVNTPKSISLYRGVHLRPSTTSYSDTSFFDIGSESGYVAMNRSTRILWNSSMSYGRSIYLRALLDPISSGQTVYLRLRDAAGNTIAEISRSDSTAIVTSSAITLTNNTEYWLEGKQTGDNAQFGSVDLIIQ